MLNYNNNGNCANTLNNRNLNYEQLTNSQLSDSNNNHLVEVDRQKYEYIKRLLLLYKAKIRETGECHYPPLVAITREMME